MPRKTRADKDEVNSRVYESKKVAKQQYFPHRRKIVRRPSDHDVSEKRQTTLMSGKIKRTDTIGDSEEDEENLEIEEDLERHSDGNAQKRKRSKITVKKNPVVARGKKRTSDEMRFGKEEDEEPIQRPAKRTTSLTTHKKTQSTRFQSKAESDSASPSESETIEDAKQQRTRQSTMTQMLDGRRPAVDTPEPEYKPTRKRTRRSWSGKNTRKDHRKQQTLTQMVPGLGSFQSLEDDDTEEEHENDVAEEKNEQSLNDALTQRLKEQGLFEPADEDDTAKATVSSKSTNSAAFTGASLEQQKQKYVASANKNNEVPENFQREEEEDFVVIQAGDDGSEDEYRPTQFIQVPAFKRTRATRRTDKSPPKTPTHIKAWHEPAQTSVKSRFSLLSTPEKRRVREIPSSQSPSESLLSTQNTPRKVDRTPLKTRSTSALNCAETPSKRKQVTFSVSDKDARPLLRRFASTIQDSDDEDEEILEGDEEPGNSVTNDPGKQPSPQKTSSSAVGIAIGTETQAILRSIDEACANEGKRVQTSTLPEESSGPAVKIESTHKQNPRVQKGNRTTNRIPTHEHISYRAGVIDESIGRADLTDFASPSTISNQTRPSATFENDEATCARTVCHPPWNKGLDSTPRNNVRELQDTYPSSPMILLSASSDEDEEELSLTPPMRSKSNIRQHSPSPLPKTPQAAKDPRVDAIASRETPNPRSKPGEDEGEVEAGEEVEEESQLSDLHSAAAEQQIHSEYATYSQFRPPGPPASSMQVAYDTRFSYQDTPRPSRTQASDPHQIQHASPNRSHQHDISQATTIDEHTKTQDLAPMVTRSTPEKDRNSPTYNNTPSKVPSSTTPKPPKRRYTEQDAQTTNTADTSSPTQPPPLVIPSSFPTPSKVLTQYRASSPTHQHHTEDSWTNDHDDDDSNNSSPLMHMHMTRGDGVGASGAGKGYTQWLAMMGADRASSGNEVDEEEGGGSWEDFSIPAFPPGMTRASTRTVGGDDEDEEMEL